MLNAAVVRLSPGPDRLWLSIEASDCAALDEVREVLESHLDRFAFREAPLAFDWADAPDGGDPVS